MKDYSQYGEQDTILAALKAEGGYGSFLDYGQALPSWFDPLMQGFVDLRTLPPNWDSYGANTIDPKTVQDAMDLLNGLLGPTSPAPRVVPLSSGGLQLEWHRQGIDLEVVFDRDEQPYFYVRNRLNGSESEHALPEDREPLRSIIGTLEFTICFWRLDK